MVETQSMLVLSTHGIIYKNYIKIAFFINYHQVRLSFLLKSSF